MTTLVLSRRRAARWNFLALLAALTTALAVWSYVSWLRAQVPAGGGMVPMVVAATDIDSGVLVTPAMLRIDRFPQSYLPDGAFRDPGAVAGRTAAVPILEGEPVTERRIGRTGGSSAAVPLGMRAYSLGAQTLNGVALVPRAGDRVDVLATYQDEFGAVQTSTIIRAAKVASVGGSDSSVASQFGVGSPDEAGITLLLTPEEAEILAQAEAVGDVALVLAPDASGR